MSLQRKYGFECPVCEQTIFSDTEPCPHCLSQYLFDKECSPDEFERSAQRLRKKLKNKPDFQIQKQLVQLLFLRGMEIRYSAPDKALQLFEEVVELEPNNWESRLKISWLSIRFIRYDRAIVVLLPVVDSPETTLLQKQRAYSNLSCAENWKPKSYSNNHHAESWARKGIALDGKGTSKLWENLATALKNQNKLEESSDALKQALKIGPKSLNVLEMYATLERQIKTEKKRQMKKKLTSLNLSSPIRLFSPTKNPYRKI